MTDVLVLPQKIQGMSGADYAATLRERLDDYDVAHARTAAEAEELITDASVVTGYDIAEELLAAATELDLFVCTFAGTDHLPQALAERGVTVENASGVHAPNVAEQVLGYLLTFVRRLERGWRQEQDAEWNHYRTTELNGSTVTVVGQGPIGTAIVDRLAAFGVHTIGVRYTPSKGGPADEVVGFDDRQLAAALAGTDHLVLACPLTELTEGLVDEAALRTLPTHATVVNVARGAVVDTDALITALRTGDIGGAALDVTDPEPLPADSPLWSLSNCRVTPHTAGHTPEYWTRCADILEEALDA